MRKNVYVGAENLLLLLDPELLTAACLRISRRRRTKTTARVRIIKQFGGQ